MRCCRGGGVAICDINPEMLAEGERRYCAEFLDNAPIETAKGVTFKVVDAMELPFEDNTFDAYTISFGIRNVTDIDLAIREVCRTLLSSRHAALV